MKRIISIGPESSGKTTIIKAIAEKLDEYFVPEYARIYLTIYGSDYTNADLDIMCQGQIDLENECLKNAKKYLISDTDLLTYDIWSKYKYGTVSELIKENQPPKQNRLYLLCSPEIPWEYDALRENPNDGEEIFELYQKKLKSDGYRFIVLKGSHEERLAHALAVILESTE